ncbi:hypothetical protein P9112_007372 [Eukaryota sp. TZLM1-RC]
MTDCSQVRRRIGDSDWVKNYKYGCIDRSLVTKYILKPYWDWAINFFPATIAPNAITMIGLFSVAIPSFIIILLTFMQFKVPAYLFFISGFSVFAYQTLDNLDGRQARRTKTSSALGEITDHCVDSFTTTIIGVSTLLGLGLDIPYAIPLTILPQITFILCAIEEYFTGSLYLGVVNAPTEGLLMISGLHIALAFGFELGNPNLYLFWFILAFSAFTMITSLVNVYLFKDSDFRTLGRCIGHFAVRMAVYPILLLLIHLSEPVGLDHVLIFLISMFLTSFQLLDVLIAVVTKTQLEVSMVTPMWLLFGGFAFVQFLSPNHYNSTVLFVLALVMTLRFVSLASAVVKIFCQDLGIRFMSMSRAQKAIAVEQVYGAVSNNAC